MEKPSLDSFVGNSSGISNGSARPSLDTFTATPFDGSQDMNNSAAVLGVTNNVNNSFQMQRDAEGKATPESMQTMQDQTTEAQNNADQANSAGGIIGETARGTMSALGNSAVKFLGSAVRAPIDIVRGLFGKAPIQGGIKDFSGNEMSSIQSDFQGNADKITRGDQNAPTPLQATGQAVGDTVSGAGDVLGAESLAKGAIKGLGALADTKVGQSVTSAVANTLEKNASKQALKVVTPELTTRETETALAQGRGRPGGLFTKASIAPDKNLTEIADVTKNIVNKGSSDIQNINNVRNAIGKEADTLATKVQSIKQPVSETGVKTWLDNVEKPIEIESDATQSRKFDLTRQRMMDIVTKNLKENPTVSSLLKSRKEFDALVQREFPTIYDRTNAAWRTSVTSMRNAMNDAIEANLPDGLGYKESLKKQRLMYQAIDNISSKASSEVGTSKAGRAIQAVKDHPIISTAGAIGADKLLKKTTGIGF